MSSCCLCLQHASCCYDRGAEYCDERVYLSVCLCVCLPAIISPELHVRSSPNFSRTLPMAVARSSRLWRRSDTLCTSGFIDDVIFAHKPRLLDVAAMCSAHAAFGLAINCASLHRLSWSWRESPCGRLPLVSARPAVTLAILKRAATSFAAWWTEARWVWTVCLRLYPKRRDCDLNPGPSAPESSTLTTRLPSHVYSIDWRCNLCYYGDRTVRWCHLGVWMRNSICSARSDVSWASLAQRSSSFTHPQSRRFRQWSSSWQRCRTTASSFFVLFI